MSLIKDFHLVVNPIQMRYRQRTTGANWDIYHAHQGMEFIYVHEGRGRVFIDQHIYAVEPGTLMFFQPYQLHRVNMDTRKNMVYERSKLLFEPSTVDQILSTLPKLQSFFRSLWRDTLPRQVLLVPEQGREWNKLLEQLEHTVQTASSEDQLEEFALLLIPLLQGLRRLLHNDQEALPRPTRPAHHAEIIINWIDEHYHEAFQLEALSKALHLTGSHVSHLFRKFTGSSITEYLTAKRLREACRLLRTSSEPIQHIAAAVGLRNVSYFCQLFKKHIGITPHQYRVNLRND